MSMRYCFLHQESKRLNGAEPSKENRGACMSTSERGKEHVKE